MGLPAGFRLDGKPSEGFNHILWRYIEGIEMLTRKSRHGESRRILLVRLRLDWRLPTQFGSDLSGSGTRQSL